MAGWTARAGAPAAQVGEGPARFGGVAIRQDPHRDDGPCARGGRRGWGGRGRSPAAPVDGVGEQQVGAVRGLGEERLGIRLEPGTDVDAGVFTDDGRGNAGNVYGRVMRGDKEAQT